MSTSNLAGQDSKFSCNFLRMSGIGERVRKRRIELGLSTPQLAKKVGSISYQTIQQVEAGGGTKHLVALANALGVNPDWLQSGIGEKLTTRGSTPRSAENGTTQNGESSVTSQSAGVAYDRSLPPLKVMGLVETGPDGWSLFNGEVIDTIPRPSILAGAKDAYAVYIVGTSMEPRYFAGEAVFVHPGKPVTVGAFVLVQLKPKADGEAPRAILKRLARRSGSKVVLEQYTPARTFDLKADEILSMHRVVGSTEA